MRLAGDSPASALRIEKKKKNELPPSSTGSWPGASLTAPAAGASIEFNRRTYSELGANSLKKLGPGSRATFVSPYLRRPLRPLSKVLTERDDDGQVEAASQQPANDALSREEPGIWSGPRKSVAASE